MNDPLVNIDIDVNLFNNIYPDLNGNQSSEYYDCPKFNKLSMNTNTDLLLLNFNIRSIGANLDTFNCFTNLLNKKIDILSFSEPGLMIIIKTCTLLRDMRLFTMFDLTVTEVEVYLYIFQMFSNRK